MDNRCVLDCSTRRLEESQLTSQPGYGLPALLSESVGVGSSMFRQLTTETATDAGRQLSEACFDQACDYSPQGLTPPPLLPEDVNILGSGDVYIWSVLCNNAVNNIQY